MDVKERIIPALTEFSTSEVAEFLVLKLFDSGVIKDRSRSEGGQGFRPKFHERRPEKLLSPLNIDLRLLRFPHVPELVVSHFQQMSRELQFDLVAATLTASIQIVRLFSEATGVPAISLRKIKTSDGGKRVLLIYYLVGKVNRKPKIIHGLESRGFVIHDILALVDREQGGVEWFEKRGYRVHVAFRLSNLLEQYFKTGRIIKSTYEEIKACLASAKRTSE